MDIDRHAERAVIGALLLEPGRYQEVAEWLEPEDFDGVAERQAYEAMRLLVDEGRQLTPSAVNEHLLANASAKPLQADAALLVTCMQECPVPSRVAVYGRMVLDSSIRRRIGSQAAGLRRRAEQAATSHDLNLVFGMVDRVRRDVERLHQREVKATGAHAPSPLKVDELPSAPRSASDEHQVSVERVAVLALVNQPLALGRVSMWLERTDFKDVECALVYGELQSMRESRQPIDALTVAWRVSRRSAAASVVAGLLEVQKAGPRLPDATIAARRVLEQSVRCAVIDASAALENVPVNTATDVPPTAEAYARLNGLWPKQRRLVKVSLTSA
jgi:replicative DNA helicase